ncbi:MAG: histidine kinase [Bacteroidota bacterium]
MVEKNEHKENRLTILFRRLVVVLFIHLIFKGFDQSFAGIFEWNLRSLSFSLFFLVSGLIGWSFAECMNGLLIQKLEKHQHNFQFFTLYYFFHLLLAFVVGVGINHGYRLGDIYAFGNQEIWEPIPFLNPELSVSVAVMYLIILGFDGFYRTTVRQKEAELKMAQLESESSSAQYHALKAQIEPHFLFNSLSVLSSLIYEDQDVASDFLIRLSKALRYIIEKKEFSVVSLHEERSFLEDFCFLIDHRFPEAITLHINVSDTFAHQAYLPPACLHALISRAISQNQYNKDTPLKIELYEDDNQLVLAYNLNPKTYLRKTHKDKLDPLFSRFLLLTGSPPSLELTERYFVIRLPILNQEAYERIDL